ncbi:MAG TPA: ATP synthase F1 subunit epsilon [Sporichthyaceae bacterium]|jgi:F-type H+-transporting ATPase subunit epsilon|nr:ATP synthase F1 subunit epsilon [Sporichthyaceae bacterium]
MAHAKFPTKILTPEGEVFNGEVEMVSTRTTVGLIGVMARHAPLLATLEPTELRLHKGEGEVERFAQSEGYLQVGDNQALLLVEDAVPVAGLDAETLRERLRIAEQQIAESGEDTERRRAAVRDKKRWELFLSLAG